MIEKIKQQIEEALRKTGVKGKIELSKPPKAEMGDIAFGCFEIAKERGKNSAQVAKEIVENFRSLDSDLEFKILNLKLFDKIEAFGPYVNFFLNPQTLAEAVLKNIDNDVGKNDLGRGKKVMVEFAHPNTHKMFHIGHLRNITTGEAIVRILENAGYKVVRANYQGDVGMHIAKCLYAVFKYDKDGIDNQKQMVLDARIRYLGEMYARGAREFEDSEKVRGEIAELNTKIYERDRSIKEVYETTRSWSLEYFDKIYKRVGSHFDRLYFESEVFERGKKIVKKGLKKKIFKESEGAVIFEGSKYEGLHDRVFINSKGYPTYEAKDLGLAELQFKEYSPQAIYHVVAREQSDYFKVMFKAQEFTLPKSKGRQHHLIYGWVSLKEGKMSSRTGQVVLGEWLLDEVKDRVRDKVKDDVNLNKDEVAERVAIAAVKYAFLKTGIANDIQFDMKESISTSGDSGPYLLYIVARIKSILKKAQETRNGLRVTSCGLRVTSPEKKLLLQLAEFSEIAKRAAEEFDPSKIAQYLFDLAQGFNNFYHECPVIQAEEETREFRVLLIQAVAVVMTRGLYLLGIETVEEM